jgi:hypothetical protein
MATALDRSREIAFHTDYVRRARVAGDTRAARGAYAALVESWKQHNALHNGAFNAQLEAVKREYSEFVKSDPDYQLLRQAIVLIIQGRPGILQTEVYTALAKVPKEQLQYALYFAADHGFIVRTKKGRTYSLTLPRTQCT